MKILIIISHCSTGGMPQVALKRVESLINEHDVYLIEYREIAWSFVVQRNKIKELLGDKFISLGWLDKEEKRDKFQSVVENINPDLIHMEEIPEMFIFGMRQEHADWLYRPERTYKITETTHTSTFNLDNKKYFPDKFLFVSKYSQKEYSRFNIPSSVIEYPVEKLEKNKGVATRKLQLNPEYFHILNVGLFNKDKNQGYIFELAKRLKDYKIHFHFVGNQAENFKNYWLPLMTEKSDNCFLYGERNDVDIFYQAADLVVHPSILELNPLTIKESTSYDLPVYLFNLPTYDGMYDSYKNVKYLSRDVDKDTQLIINNFNLKRIDDNKTFGSILIDEYQKLVNLSPVLDNVVLEEDYYEYNINFTDGARIEILGKNERNFDIEIYDNHGFPVYEKTISTNNWCCTNIKYYKEYTITVKSENKLYISHTFNLKNRNVLINLDSKSIGDTIAWFPYVEEFRKKHDCVIYCTTFWNKWFINQYPEIKFVEPGGGAIPEMYARYIIGWTQPWSSDKNPIDYKKIPLQKTASDILGLEYKEIKPNIDAPEGVRPIKDKYVCLAQFSTANTKHWHYPYKDSNKGWQIMVDWLNEQGYKVVVISKQKTNLKNIIDRTGNFPIEHRINDLKWCDFFIGIGSGLSWLAWALGKKVVMISGFSDPICEFQTNNINVHNYNVCNGCFNRHQFDRGAWNWCPEHADTDRQFECSINITPEMIAGRIISSKLIENVQPFDFKKYDISVNLSKDLITLSYEKENNKFIVGYLGNIPTPEINFAIKDFHTNKNYHVVSDISLSRDYFIWASPKDIVHTETDKVIISFFNTNKLLDIELSLL